VPGINGYDFYKAIQQIKFTSTIPLIFVTAKCEKKDFRAGMNLGVDDYITKPFDYNELLFSIKTRFDKSEKFQQNNDKKYYAFINNPLTGVFIYSKNKFDFVNEKCMKIFGMSTADFSNMTFDNLITGNDKDSVLEKIECCFSKAQNTIHTCFQANHFKEKHDVTVEIYAGIVNFKGTDSLIGYMSESSSVDKIIPFPAEKEEI
jgi:PAS domain S-box-containing protein